ncbi:CHRD domain-containing protein [Micromonospora thermarum]|uniref:CHRD domain-containing protein n=1 Tax=Micromonospora thermarum TaxID=2720024 RepID=A0ABX0Z2H8_9ACTN|nr:CHRD domain-containing protein [Micromonospora thermarum]NJP32007.1 CHRD domain-containing protein [Micromonospora thermarum]
MGRTRLWAVALAAGAAVAATAAGGAAMGGGKDDAGDRRDSSDSRDWGDSKGERFDVRAKLSGYEEDPLTISTTGNGRFEAHVDEGKKEIEFRLSYADLEGKVNAAHIHFGGRHQSGGIIAFLCGSPSKDGKGGAPKGTKECPPSPAKVEGTIKPADVIGPQEQGIKPGEFDEVVEAIKAGVTYVNVHTDKYPNGEIRGQIKKDRKKDDEKPDWGSKDDEKLDWDWSKDDEESDWGGKDDKGEHSDEKDRGSEHREG